MPIKQPQDKKVRPGMAAAASPPATTCHTLAAAAQRPR